MRAILYQKQLTALKHRHQRLQFLMSAMLLMALLQTGLLWGKRERIIVHPPETTQAYWVEGHRFSASYLEEMARYFCHLMLDVTPESIQQQAQVLLRYATPEAYGALKAQLVADSKRLREQQLALHFVPKTTTVEIALLKAEVTGELHRYVGIRRLDSEQRTWCIRFVAVKGKLFIKGFEAVDRNREGTREM